MNLEVDDCLFYCIDLNLTRILRKLGRRLQRGYYMRIEKFVKALRNVALRYEAWHFLKILTFEIHVRILIRRNISRSNILNLLSVVIVLSFSALVY